MKLRIVPARTGLQWVRQGIGTCSRQPLALCGLLPLLLLVIVLTGLLPEAAGLPQWVSSSVPSLLYPAFSLTVMVAAAEVWQGRKLRLSLLWVAFHDSRCARAMLTLGALYCAGEALVFAASALLDGGQFARLYLGLGKEANAEMGAEEMLALFSDNPDLLRAAALALCGYLLLGLLFWHAPALAYWHRVTPLKALFFSTVACVRNAGAFLVYGLVWAGLGSVCTAVPALFVALLAPASDTALIIVLGALVLLLPLWCAFQVSVVFSFRDCFAAPPRRVN